MAFRISASARQLREAASFFRTVAGETAPSVTQSRLLRRSRWQGILLNNNPATGGSNHLNNIRATGGTNYLDNIRATERTRLLRPLWVPPHANSRVYATSSGPDEPAVASGGEGRKSRSGATGGGGSRAKKRTRSTPAARKKKRTSTSTAGASSASSVSSTSATDKTSGTDPEDPNWDEQQNKALKGDPVSNKTALISGSLAFVGRTGQYRIPARHSQ